MADLFALSKIQDEILFRNDEYVSPEKAKAIKRIRCGALHCVSLARARLRSQYWTGVSGILSSCFYGDVYLMFSPALAVSIANPC